MSSPHSIPLEPRTSQLAFYLVGVTVWGVGVVRSNGMLQLWISIAVTVLGVWAVVRWTRDWLSWLAWARSDEGHFQKRGLM